MLVGNDDNADLIGVQRRLQARIATLEAEIFPMQEELSRLRIQSDLVGRALNAGSGETGTPDALNEVPTVRASVSDRIFDILKNASEALHVSEIKSRYLAKGYVIPGQGNESNLLVYIVRDHRFVRVSKGTYALSKGEPLGNVVAKPKAKRRRRKKVREKSNG